MRGDAAESNALLNETASHNPRHSLNFANIPVLPPAPTSVQPLRLGQPEEKSKQKTNSKLQAPEPSGAEDIVLNSEVPEKEQVLAVTLDSTIHVSPNASRLSQPELDRLIAHESVHVAQQNLQGRPGTRSELEHEANALVPLALAGEPFRPLIPASPATALRDELTIGTDAASQQTWVSRVDTIVRNRFGLAGARSRLTDPGRVAFQDAGTFARGFGSSPRDLLFEVFAEGLGAYAHRIMDFYDFRVATESPQAPAEINRFIDAHIGSGFLYWNYHALDWTDYGLTGITYEAPYSSLERVPGNPNLVNASLLHNVTRAQADAAVSRQPRMHYDIPDGRQWPADPSQTQLIAFHLQVPLSRVTHQLSAGEILAQTYAGITSGGARGTRRVRIQSTPAQPGQPATAGRPATPAIPARPANVSTLVHEACHFYAHDNFNRFVDGVRTTGTIHQSPVTLTSISSTRLSPILEEGFTEYFTRMIMQEQAATLGTTGTAAYQSQHDAARLIIVSMRPPAAAESAYFQGNAGDIQKVRDGIQFVLQNPNTVRVLGGIGMEETERAFESVRGPARPTPPGNGRLRPRTP